MKRTKEWWARLTKTERSELVTLQTADSRNGGYHSLYIPDDCTECPHCGMPHLGAGLCPVCSGRLENLIAKADGRFQINVMAL